MREITVPVGDRSYPILLGAGILDSLGTHVRAAGIRGSVALVQDQAVAGLFGRRVRRSLEAAGYRVSPVAVPSGEASKSLAQLGALYEAFAGARLDRGSAVVALGGGVIGDLAGFAAATYLRGIDFVQVPTTLLAQVDASVGGKTGIDLPTGKNLVGAFHQPRLVLIDLETLDTMPEAEYRAGFAEVIKYGVIEDACLFDFLESNRDALLGHYPDALLHVVARSCEIKARVVGQDERESGLRAILNYGHTVGHAVETAAGYGEYLHGEAVAIGMAAAGRLSSRLGWLSDEDAERIERLLAGYGLPVRLREPLPEEGLVRAMRLDKKARDGELRFILARAIGRVESAPVLEPDARAALRKIQAAGT
jgi:3-dehydroquinate synthase